MLKAVCEAICGLVTGILLPLITAIIMSDFFHVPNPIPKSVMIISCFPALTIILVIFQPLRIHHKPLAWPFLATALLTILVLSILILLGPAIGQEAVE